MARLAAAVMSAWVAVVVVLGVDAVNAQPLPPRALLPQGSPLPRVLLPTPADVGPGLGPPQPRSLEKILPGATIEVTHTELRGMTACDMRDFNEPMRTARGQKAPNAKVAVSIDGAAAVDRVIEVLLSYDD